MRARLRSVGTVGTVGRIRRYLPHRDPRLVLGLVLIGIAAVVGTRVLGAAGARSPVWAAAHDLAGGTVLSAADVVQVRVHLGSAQGRYVAAAGRAPVGRRLAGPLNTGELLPTAAIESSADRRLVTLPVEGLHLPTGLGHGALVDVYVTPRDPGTGALPSRLVLSGALVAAVASSDSSAGGEVAVVLDVPPAQAGDLVTAVRGGAIDLVGRSS